MTRSLVELNVEMLEEAISLLHTFLESSCYSNPNQHSISNSNGG